MTMPVRPTASNTARSPVSFAINVTLVRNETAQTCAEAVKPDGSLCDDGTRVHAATPASAACARARRAPAIRSRLRCGDG
jgi:hypothetical protein